MKQNTGVQEQSLLATSEDIKPIELILSRQLRLTPEEDALVFDLGKAFEIVEFGLGRSLENPCLNSPGTDIQRSNQTQYFYVVCQGQVRLLCFDAQQQREVSAQLLMEGKSFGGDCLFGEVSLPYRAIAASPTQVARIPIERLQPWLSKLPSLSQYWLAQTQHRQALIFFKTLTALRSLSSRRLQQLLPCLEEKRIEAGELLAQATPSDAGRFWLRSGKIEPQLLEVGSSWGYPEAIPLDWVAQTDLLVYQLPKAHWEAVSAIDPRLVAALIEKPSSELEVTSQNGFKPDGNDPHPLTPSPPLPFSPPVQSQTDSQAVEFPQPSQHRRPFGRGCPFVEQQSSSDCGAACLAMISQYWGKRFSLNSLRELAGIGRSGASLKGLAKTADSLGYHARPVRASLSRLLEQDYPWIAHWKGDHYIVVDRVKGNKILVVDPARGKRWLERQDFLASWTGYALLLEPTERLYETPNEKRSLSRFLSILWTHRVLGWQIILVSVLIQILGLVSPLFTQVILDQIVVNKSQITLNFFIAIALICGLWGIGLSSVRHYLLSYLSIRLDLTLIGGFIKHALTLPLKFFESRRVGDILARVQENQKIQRFLIGQVLLAWLDFVTGFIYLGLMFYYNWRLTLLILLLIPPIAILTLVATPFLRRISREFFNALEDQSSTLVEMMTGVSAIKAAAAERELRWRWEGRLTNQLNVQFKGQKLAINLGIASGLINSLGGLALLWYGATLVIQDQLTIGQLVAFNMMIGRVISPVLTLTDLWDELQEVLISVERLNDVFDNKSEEPPGNQMLVLPAIQGEVQFEDVTFRYDADEERNTLQNISFAVKPGQTIAIVGRSGSGKSTLVKLLQGMYYPINGRIWIDGHDIRHVSPQSLRSQLGVVPQECFLFSGTILENITLFRSEFNLEQAVEVAKLAEAHAFIQSMPLGYNTKVGERGMNLSGGQRQRIAIARALLGNPRILILDEATSSLDTESERRFQQNLAHLSRERTIFIIAHRLSTVRHADCILVLDRGVLIEQGTHEELMEQQKLYYHLAQQQLDL
ncbi:MAG: cysteine peptidase family C39 domain-containing protein [Hydrococcus sp. Prado102]|nr:cysteine peptidase family C39 domain-containing protein [Hydrococcus sp. Prado102]